MTWVFQESDPMGGAAGEAYANTLKSPGMQPEHVLAREAIQNSVDAGIEGEKVRICFRQVQLANSAKTAFVQAAGLAHISERIGELELTVPNCLTTLDKPRTPLTLLYVEDHNAVGLSGDPHDKNSNFYRLLLSLGDRSKARTSKGTGGSYGFGKSVYSSSSAIQTIFAYTRFADDEGTECTRLFGCGYYASHEHKGKNYSGRAWLGTKKHSDGAGRLVIDPYEGKPADKLAEALGFEPRDKGDLGTSILIVDATVDLRDLVIGVEDWWWPRLIDQKLDVEIHDAAGGISVPRPRRNEQLRPFIEAFEIARGVAAPKSGTQKQSPLNRLGDLALGVCGFVVAPLNDQGNPIVRADRCNTIALIRAPLMVVAYKPCSETAPVVVGAFVAADDIDLVLKKSEPPAHDRWDPDSANLRDIKGEGKSVVMAVMSRIKDHLKRFQREAAPPTPVKQKRLSILERALGSYFRPQGMGGKPQPEVVSSPLHLEFTKQPFAEAASNGMLRLRSAFSVALDSGAEEESVSLKLHVRCPVLEDEGQEGEDLNLKIDVKGVAATPTPDDPKVLRFVIERGGKATFTVESEEYDAAWTVRLRPEIDAEAA
ncbi:hypothetical protein C0Z18_32140 [Trinickia dabaoshanensis]|uniref:Uncharacterized protein n=1 Tax=Trinickia dabaoshanensis TaxID=564714 RepID=A0A2N7VAZ2_9BURK|nr:hypothetical protein [Trinickia dabaoshanensis]PMS14330.1 hypothetical protein C0Z18_32140 [Trinickia dabaoshanensis]